MSKTIDFTKIASIDGILDKLQNNQKDLKINHIGYALARAKQLAEKNKKFIYYKEFCQYLSSLIKRKEQDKPFWSSFTLKVAANISNGLKGITGEEGYSVIKAVVNILIKIIPELGWSKAKPIDIHEMLNGLAQLKMRLPYNHRLIQAVLTGVSHSNPQWKSAGSSNMPNILNGLAQLIKGEESDTSINTASNSIPIKSTELLIDKSLLQVILDRIAGIDWSNAKTYDIANTLNGLAQLNVKLSVKDAAIQKILDGIVNKKDWQEAEAKHFAHIFNGLGQLGVRLTTDDQVVVVLLNEIEKKDWSQAEPFHIALILNGLVQSDIKLTVNHPAIRKILKELSKENPKLPKAKQMELTNILNSLRLFKIDSQTLKEVLHALNIKDQWQALLNSNKEEDKRAIVYFMDYIHHVLKDEVLQKDFPLQKIKFSKDCREPSFFQEDVKVILQKKLPQYNILMQYQEGEFAYLPNSIDIVIQDKSSHEVIGFIEVEGPSHYVNGLFNLKTESKHALLEHFSTKQHLLFARVGNHTNKVLEEREVLDQLAPFLQEIEKKQLSKNNDAEIKADFQSVREIINALEIATLNNTGEQRGLMQKLEGRLVALKQKNIEGNSFYNNSLVFKSEQNLQEQPRRNRRKPHRKPAKHAKATISGLAVSCLGS